MTGGDAHPFPVATYGAKMLIDNANIVTTSEPTPGTEVMDLNKLAASGPPEDLTATVSCIKTLAAAAHTFEITVYSTANQHLYHLLQQCYALFHHMCIANNHAAILRNALAQYKSANQSKVAFKDSAHTLSKIIHCVFAGIHQKRLSAYCNATLAVLEKKVPPADFCNHIDSRGGIEALRRNKSNSSANTEDKIDNASSWLQQHHVTDLNLPPLEKQLDAGNAGKPLLLLVTQNADGSLTVHDLVKSPSIVNAALLDFYKNHKAEHANKAAEAATASQNADLDAARDAAANAALLTV